MSQQLREMLRGCHQASGELCEKTQDPNNWLDKDNVAKFLTPSTDLLAAFPLLAASWLQETESLYTPPHVAEPAALLLDPPHGGGGAADGQSYPASSLKTLSLVAPGLSTQQKTTSLGWAVLSSYFILARKYKINLWPVYQMLLCNCGWWCTMHAKIPRVKLVIRTIVYFEIC